MSLPPLHFWGVTGALAPLQGGHRNQVFKLTRPDGDLVFKATRRSADALAWVQDVMTRLGPDLCAPAIKPSLSGHLIERGWTCEPFIRGSTLSKEQAQQVKLPALKAPQRPGFITTAALCDADVSGDIALGVMPDNIVAACRAAWQPLKDMPTRVVHGDLNPSNLIGRRDGRICLIDWEEARVDAQVFDHPAPTLSPALAKARTAFEVAACWQSEPEHARHLAKSLTW